jgi:Glycosyl hydrolases family 16
MNKILLIILLTLIISKLFGQLPPSDPNYQLVFEDNFDSTAINTSKWKSMFDWNQTGYYPDWVCQPIKDQGWGYCKMNFENCTVSNGTLKIVSKKEQYNGVCWSFPDCSSSSCIGKPCSNSYCWNTYSLWFNYTTNILISKETFKYGYFEIRCKFSKPIPPKTNQGAGPTFWLWSGAGPTVTWSEIDLFEFNGLTGKFGSSIHYEDIYGNKTHVEKPDKLTTFGRTKLTTSKLLFF